MATNEGQNPTPDSSPNATPAVEQKQKDGTQSFADKYAFPVIVGLTIPAVLYFFQLHTQVVQMQEKISSLQSDQVSAVALQNHLNDTRQSQADIRSQVDALRQRVEALCINESAINNELKDINIHVSKADHELLHMVGIRERLAVLETTLKLMNPVEERRSSAPAVSKVP